MAGTAPYASAARRIADEILDSVENDEDVRTATETAVQTMTLFDLPGGGASAGRD